MRVSLSEFLQRPTGFRRGGLTVRGKDRKVGTSDRPAAEDAIDLSARAGGGRPIGRVLRLVIGMGERRSTIARRTCSERRWVSAAHVTSHDERP